MKKLIPEGFTDYGNKDPNAIVEFIVVMLEQELTSVITDLEEIPEANTIGSGAVVGYGLPLGMDTTPGKKKLWSGDEPGSDHPKNEACRSHGPKVEYNPMPSELWEFEMTRENVLDAMGQKHVGGAKRKAPYGDTYVGFSSGKHEDESGRDKQAGIVQKVNKNLNKKPYTLHDPPAMGLK